MIRGPIFIAVFVLGTGLAFPVDADEIHTHHASSEAKPVAATKALSDGEVRKVDKAAGTITIKHGPLPKFDMPAMTMAYKVKDKTTLDQLKSGDKIRFDVESAGGAYTVTRLEKVK